MIFKGLKNPGKAIRYISKKSNKYISGRWYNNHSISAEEHFIDIDQEIWDETIKYSESLQNELYNKYDDEVHTADFHPDSSVGGGAAHDILYFYTRYKRPQTVVETGVSAGWSSRTILDALHKNKKGTLYSNDLPYSERPSKKNSLHPNKEQIGILVDEKIKYRWELYIGPDKENLSKILDEINTIDLLHYDSDKSYSGRSFAMEEVKPKMHDSSVVIMDDISDNGYFRDFVRRENVQWEVFESPQKGKKVGIIEGKW